MIGNATPGGAGKNDLKIFNYPAGSSQGLATRSATFRFNEPGRYVINATAYKCTSVSTTSASISSYTPSIDGDATRCKVIDAVIGQTVTVSTTESVQFILIKIIGDWNVSPSIV